VTSSIHDPRAFEAWRRAQRLNPHALRDFINDLLKRGRTFDDARRRLSEAGVAGVAIDELDVHALTIAERHDSALDGATKLLFATRGRERIEAVILRYATGRTSLCVSSQVGCAAACGFCATGRMGLVRSLTAAEILDQVVQANQLLAAENVRVRNLVFMGMGEPFHNEDAVHAAIEALSDPRRFDYSSQRILVSTVGVPDAMVRFARRFPRTHLALSLHSAVQEKRETLIPLARRASVAALRETVAEVNALQRRPVMIEYVMLEDWNDGADDLEALAAWLVGLDVHVNLIPFNAIEGEGGLTGTAREARERFGAALKGRGFKVTLRYSLGRDIAAACGQLVREESRRRGRVRAGD
jgi:23S rRNA (adenine2503-C2)-methyltransferase